MLRPPSANSLRHPLIGPYKSFEKLLIGSWIDKKEIDNIHAIIVQTFRG